MCVYLLVYNQKKDGQTYRDSSRKYKLCNNGRILVQRSRNQQPQWILLGRLQVAALGDTGYIEDSRYKVLSVFYCKVKSVFVRVRTRPIFTKFYSIFIILYLIQYTCK